MNTSWTERAACHGLDPVIFFPPEGEPADDAKRICDHCAVRSECLEHALRSREREGVWGGATELERRRIIRRRRRAAAASVSAS